MLTSENRCGTSLTDTVDIAGVVRTRLPRMTAVRDVAGGNIVSIVITVLLLSQMPHTAIPYIPIYCTWTYTPV